MERSVERPPAGKGRPHQEAIRERVEREAAAMRQRNAGKVQGRTEAAAKQQDAGRERVRP